MRSSHRRRAVRFVPIFLGAISVSAAVADPSDPRRSNFSAIPEGSVFTLKNDLVIPANRVSVPIRTRRSPSDGASPTECFVIPKVVKSVARVVRAVTRDGSPRRYAVVGRGYLYRDERKNVAVATLTLRNSMAIDMIQCRAPYRYYGDNVPTVGSGMQALADYFDLEIRTDGNAGTRIESPRRPLPPADSRLASSDPLASIPKGTAMRFAFNLSFWKESENYAGYYVIAPLKWIAGYSVKTGNSRERRVQCWMHYEGEDLDSPPASDVTSPELHPEGVLHMKRRSGRPLVYRVEGTRIVPGSKEGREDPGFLRIDLSSPGSVEVYFKCLSNGDPREIEFGDLVFGSDRLFGKDEKKPGSLIHFPGLTETY